MDTNDTDDMSGGPDQGQDELSEVPEVPEVPERPTPSGWVVVKKARTARAKAVPGKKAAPRKKAAPKRKAAPVAKKRSSGKRELIDTGTSLPEPSHQVQAPRPRVARAIREQEPGLPTKPSIRVIE